MGAMVGTSASGVYKAAISQAPVTDWRYYGQCTSTISTIITHIMIVALRFHEQYTAFNLLGLCDDATYLQTQFIQSDTWAYQLMKAIPMR